MRTILLILTCAAALAAADSDFNGRWDISAPEVSKRSAWWLEVENAGTPQIKGRFVGFWGGDMNVIPRIAIVDGKLRFELDKGGEKPWKSVYTASLENGKLVGVRESTDGSATVKWTGVRAPEINEKDDATWVEAKPVKMFNGKNLKGWISRAGSTPQGWTVKDGVVSSTGRVADLVSMKKFWNFKLHIEYRLAAHSNSGIGLRGRYEVQVLEDYGRAPGTHGSGAVYSRILPTENATRPANEWNTYDVRLVGRTVTVVMNGKTVIDHKEIEGLTAIASDPNEGEPGPFVLQGDHGPVDFRNMVVTPLVKKK